jgi:ABC-type multidrug transport system ATPase subunit
MTTSVAPVLAVRDVSKRYGRREVLDGVSFSVAPGTIVALLGGNGAGKTTTLKCVLGITSFEGSIEVNGRSVADEGRAVRGMMGYVPQLPALSEDDTCRQALSFVAELRRVPAARLDESLDRVRLGEERDTKVGELSGGMRQRLALAAALVGDPTLLLLDEPTASLDAPSRAEFDEVIRQLRAEGKTILLSTHQHTKLDDLADQILVLDQGRLIFDGRMRELLDAIKLNRYVVNLNGSAPHEFFQALGALGIREDRVARAPVPWDELMAAMQEKGDGRS